MTKSELISELRAQVEQLDREMGIIEDMRKLTLLRIDKLESEAVD